MMRPLSVALIALASSVAQSQPATLKGRVLVDSIEKPIAGAIVTIDALKLQATTDSLGQFTIPGIAPGEYIVMAKRIGFAMSGARLRFSINETMSAEFELV